MDDCRCTIHQLSDLSQNGGTSCPSCRGLSTSVIPSRVLQCMVNILLRADPSRVRTPSERAQADEIYRPGQSLRVRNRFPLGHQRSTNGRADPSTKGTLARTNSASQYRLRATLPPLHPRKSLWMEVRPPHHLQRGFRLTFVSAVRTPSQIRTQTKTKDGFWMTVPLLATGSVDTGDSPVVLDLLVFLLASL